LVEVSLMVEPCTILGRAFASHSNNRAVDIDVNAMHTYKANLEHDDTKLYLGSINNFLFDVFTGCRHLPQRGDIDLIVGGSPCQGFSIANRTGHETTKSINNSALVCTALSAIDFYRPKYAILENVPTMTTDRKYKGQLVNVSNQIMCALIGMGYQCRCFFLDAWHFGAAQSRTRLFIEIAAPGCPLASIPVGSHEYDLSQKNRTLGKTAADRKLLQRDLDALTSFPAIQVGDIWNDLPYIGNSHMGICIPYPDHKTYYTANSKARRIMSYIPHSNTILSHETSLNPGYLYASHRNLIPESFILRQIPESTDARFRRLHSTGLAPTITCVQAPSSRIQGKTLHYNQDRIISNMEAKRAQGFFDTDVLIGKQTKQYRIIGNSVCRQVAFALGVKLAEAVEKTPFVPDEEREEDLREIRKKGRSKVMVVIEVKRKRLFEEFLNIGQIDENLEDGNVDRDGVLFVPPSIAMEEGHAKKQRV
jgi:DNA (cytosine-5)-methyltransferase 1